MSDGPPKRNPARGGRTGPDECSLLDAENLQNIAQIPRPAQAFLAPLRRLVAEGCLRLAALKLLHAANNIAIGDDHAAWPAIDCAEVHCIEGTALLLEEEEGVE